MRHFSPLSVILRLKTRQNERPGRFRAGFRKSRRRMGVIAEAGTRGPLPVAAVGPATQIESWYRRCLVRPWHLDVAAPQLTGCGIKTRFSTTQTLRRCDQPFQDSTDVQWS